MIYGSGCSGIEAATVAWEPLGWKPAWFAEIEPGPCSVLQHHYPDVPNLGDLTTVYDNPHSAVPLDLIVAGTPCQGFSVAGLRKGLADDRSNLCLAFVQLVLAKHPRWVVWENVPGVFTTGKGEDFGCFLSGLSGVDIPVPDKGWKNSGVVIGADGYYSLAWRVLDAQYTGVPQRRRRVFVVGYLGDCRRAAAVLFERHSLSGHPAPRREKGQGITHDVAESLSASGRGTERTGSSRGQDPVIACQIAPAIPAHKSGGGFGTDFDCDGGLIAIQGAATRENPDRAKGVAVAFRTSPNCGAWETGDRTDALTTATDLCSTVMVRAMAVRRLTPRECERLQGFPDDYTLVPHKGKPLSDGARYKALGNSMAIPCMRWIGERIQMVEDALREIEESRPGNEQRV